MSNADAEVSKTMDIQAETEEGVTMVDVLEEEEALEDDCAAVLGSVSDSSCTYSLGYLPRQPLYACKECTKDDGDKEGRAGFCLACSYHCHEGCNLIELYTKRNFKCDCGTTKMTRRCKLEPDKQDNTENSYNQNFSGLYCTCHRPYPDPDDPVDDVMIQCVVCEDWFHGRHTDMGDEALPAEETYAEMICSGCVAKYEFLQSYVGLAVTKIVKDTSDGNLVSVKVDSDNSTSEKLDTSSSDCKLIKSKSKVLTSLFLPDNWRKSLCKCPSCIKMYSELKVQFLTDEKDTVHYYESQAKVEKKNTLEHGMEALSKMDRIKQVEAIHSYNNMKQNLMEYLAKFADNKKVVREEDIRDFFDGMKNKKRKYDHDGPPPSNCK